MVTDLDYIKKISQGTEIELTGWEKDIPFVCKVKRVSMLGLVSLGKIPNPLLGPVMALFDGDKQKINKINAKEMSDIIEVFCKNTLLEPSYEQVKEVLTDQQRTELFNYAQGGVVQLEKFRNKRRNTVDNINVDGLQTKTK